MYIFLLVQFYSSSLCLLVRKREKNKSSSVRKATQPGRSLVRRRICLAGIEWFRLKSRTGLKKKIQIPVIYNLEKNKQRKN